MARDGFTRPRLRYDGAGDPRQDPFLKADAWLTKKVAAVIDRHYPSHQWSVRVSHRDGVVQIKIPLFMGATNWYVIKIAHIKSDPGLTSVVRACGEILERYRIPRQAFGRDDFLHARSLIPKHRLGTHGLVPN